ncbi:MAG: hypothetical protein U1G07_21115 [Verrucomicrobiota bacterium]
MSAAPASEGKSPGKQPGHENPALRRRRLRIALIQEFGGHAADMKAVAAEAIRRGMYSPRTNRGDVELSLIRTWKLRNRLYSR